MGLQGPAEGGPRPHTLLILPFPYSGALIPSIALFRVQFSTHHFSCSDLHFLFYFAIPEKVTFVIYKS